MFRLLAFLPVFAGVPLFANAQCASDYTQLAGSAVCQEDVGGSNPACASSYGPVANVFVCQKNGNGATTMINDSDASVIYSTVGNKGTGTTWFLASTANATDATQRDYQNDEHYSNFCDTQPFQVFGADLVVNFTGTGITWIGRTGPNFGVASYSVDGGPRMGFDAYNPSYVYQNNNVVVSGLADGSHSLKIEVTHYSNPYSSDYYQVIDAFNITGLPLPLYQGTIAGYDSPELSLSGPWTCAPQDTGSDLSGGHCYSNARNASISWTFAGSLIEVFGRPDLENGIFNVFIDGTKVAAVDGHYGNIDNDALNGYGFFQSKVTPGTHTITLVNTGTRDAAATNTYTQIDMFVAFP